MYTPQKFPHHLQYVATLPCGIGKFQNVTKFSRATLDIIGVGALHILRGWWWSDEKWNLCMNF